MHFKIIVIVSLLVYVLGTPLNEEGKMLAKFQNTQMLSHAELDGRIKEWEQALNKLTFAELSEIQAEKERLEIESVVGQKVHSLNEELKKQQSELNKNKQAAVQKAIFKLHSLRRERREVEASPNLENLDADQILLVKNAQGLLGKSELTAEERKVIDEVQVILANKNLPRLSPATTASPMSQTAATEQTTTTLPSQPLTTSTMSYKSEGSTKKKEVVSTTKETPIQKAPLQLQNENSAILEKIKQFKTLAEGQTALVDQINQVPALIEWVATNIWPVLLNSFTKPVENQNENDHNSLPGWLGFFITKKDTQDYSDTEEKKKFSNKVSQIEDYYSCSDNQPKCRPITEIYVINPHNLECRAEYLPVTYSITIDNVTYQVMGFMPPGKYARNITKMFFSEN
jgi:hypothetical protein